MSPGPVEELVWVAADAAWRGRSGATSSSSDGFVLMETVPDATNSGPELSITTIDTTTTHIYGPTDPDAVPATFNRTRFTNIITTHGYVDFYDCEGVGGPGTGDTGCFDCRSADNLRTRFFHCRMSPADTSAYMDGVIGHHYEAYRCDVSRVVDAFGVYNQFGPDANVIIEGCYLHDFAHFSAPTTGIVHPSDTHTHGDACQVQAGNNVTFRGNAVHGYTKNFSSSLAATKGYDIYADGSTPASPYNYLPQGFLTQQNPGVKVGGTYHSSGYVCDGNWWWGTQQTIRNATTSAANGRSPYTAQAKNNTWMDMPWDWGGSLHYYPVRPVDIVTLNGVIYPTGNVATPDAFGNHFDTNPAVLSAYRGQPVGVRCDAGL